MTEEGWLSEREPDKLLACLYGKAGERKIRLFGCGCCRQVEHLLDLTEFVNVIYLVERFTDGFASAEELRRATRSAETAFDRSHARGIHYDRSEDATLEISETCLTDFRHPIESVRVAAEYARGARAGDPAHFVCPPWPEPKWSGDPPKIEVDEYLRACEERDAALEVQSARLQELEAITQVALLRDIFGNPFRPVALDRAWLTSDVLALARSIYEEKAIDRMPILADALQDAGCNTEEVLNHCRDTQLAHVRGCWVVDLLTGRG